MPECCTTPVTADNEVPAGCEDKACTKTLVPPFEIKNDKHFYVPGDAWLDGWMKGATKHNWGVWGLRNTKLFGYGVLSGRRYQRIFKKDNDLDAMNGLQILGAKNVTISGLTFVDNINHHFIGVGENILHSVNTMHHVKVIGWRANGDGTHFFNHWNAHDLFLRTQDDSTYVIGGSNGRDGVIAQTLRRIITWNDANGVPFILSAQGAGSGVVLEDCEVIYHRKSWPWWCGAVFELRNAGPDIHNFTAKNIYVSDKFPTCPLFQLTGGMSNAHFENVTMDAFSAYQQLPQWACGGKNWRWLDRDGSDCDLPYGIPNQIVGAREWKRTRGKFDPRFEIKHLSLKDVTIGGRNASVLVRDPRAFTIINATDFRVDGQAIS